MPQTAGLQCPVHAPAIRGHCMYVNAPFCSCREWWVPLGSPTLGTTLSRLLRLGTSLRGDHAGHSHHTVSMPSWDCPEELKGCGKELRFLSLFLVVCRERRITTLTFLTFLEYCLTVLFHVRILLSAKALLGFFYFNAGNPKQWEDRTIM